MTNAELITKLQALDPNAQATISIKNVAGITTIMPVQWIAKGSIYSKQTEPAPVATAPKPF